MLPAGLPVSTPKPRPAAAISAYTSFRSAFLAEPCADCGLSRTRRNVVFDRGNAAAPVAVIGEAPGAAEDASGRCFVGRSGKLLDKILAACGLDPSRDVIIMNVVKCRPPANRVPKREEVDACRPHLERQLALARPRLVILLGGTAVRRVCPERVGEPMAELVGRPFAARVAGIETEAVVFYHPAYLLYDPRKRADVRGHAASLRAHLGRRGLLSADPPPAEPSL